MIEPEPEPACRNPECGICHVCQLPHLTSEHARHLSLLEMNDEEIARLRTERDEALAAMSSDGADAVGDNQVLRSERDRLRALVGELVETLAAIIGDPYGCSLCDGGTPRNEAKGHQPDCEFVVAEAVLRKAREVTG